jgi:hypothetical protein
MVSSGPALAAHGRIRLLRRLLPRLFTDGNDQERDNERPDGKEVNGMKGKRPDYSVNTVIPTDNGDRWRERPRSVERETLER